MTIAPAFDSQPDDKLQNWESISTGNLHGDYSTHDINEENKKQKIKAVNQLLSELNQGLRSAQNRGWITEEDFRTHFKNRRYVIR